MRYLRYSLLFLIMHFSIILYSTVKREYMVDIDNVILRSYYQFEDNQDTIIVNCVLENNSNESIFLNEDIASNWDTTANIDSLNFFKYGKSHLIDYFIGPYFMHRIYELKPGQKKDFKITIYFDNDLYEKQIIKSCPLIIDYYKYNEKIAKILKENSGEQFGFDKEKLFWEIYYQLHKVKRSLKITLDFKEIILFTNK